MTAVRGRQPDPNPRERLSFLVSDPDGQRQRPLQCDVELADLAGFEGDAEAAGRLRERLHEIDPLERRTFDAADVPSRLDVRKPIEAVSVRLSLVLPLAVWRPHMDDTLLQRRARFLIDDPAANLGDGVRHAGGGGRRQSLWTAAGEYEQEQGNHHRRGR
jgi:hypothetical protein